MTKSTRGWSPALTLAAVFAATCLVFLPSLDNGFVNFDDKPYLLENHAFRGFGLEQLSWILTNRLGGPYQPLTWLAFAADHALWGMNPRAFHAINILMHSANAALVYLLILALWSASGESRPAEPATARIAAAIGALFFSLHPLRVESVGWAIERKDLLSGFFYLCTALAYLRASAGQAAEDSRRKWRRGALAAFLLSLLSKSIGVSLPLSLLILDLYPLRRLAPDPRRWLSPEFRPVLVEKLPFAALAAAALAIGVIGQREEAAMPSWSEFGLLPRLAQSAYGLCFYLWKTALPWGLSPLYERPEPFDPLAARFLLAMGGAAALCALCVRLRDRLPALPAAAAFYAVTLLPVLGLFPFGAQLVADRYSYLACLGGSVLLAAVLKSRDGPLIRAGAGAALLALALLCVRQQEIWKDSYALWEHALRVDPSNSIAHVNLGAAHTDAGKDSLAFAEFSRAIELNARNLQARLNLADLLDKRGDGEEALEQYRAALRIDPEESNAIYALGARGTPEERKEYASRSFKKPPRFRFGPRTPAPEAAKRRYELALARDPGNRNARNNLANILAAEGRLAEAVEHFERALASGPPEPAIHFNLANTLALKGDLKAALGHYREALRLKPDFAAARENLEIIERVRR